MRTASILLLLLLWFTLSPNYTWGQDETPSVVLQAFKKKYPKAQDVNWDQEEGKGFYVVTFFDGEESYELVYDKVGKVLETTHFVLADDVPAPLMRKVETEWPKHEISGVGKCKTAAGGESWMFLVENDTELQVVHYDSTGKQLSKRLRTTW
jgi:hypothetical protein